MRVRFTPSARRQFLNAVAYIRREKPSAAGAFHQKAEQKLSRLKDFPESGRRIPEYPDLPYREVIIRPYRFFYRFVGEDVWIVAVWHGAQLPDEPKNTNA